MYISTIALFSMKESVMDKLENTVTSLFSGKTGNKVPLRKLLLTHNSQRGQNLRNFQPALQYSVLCCFSPKPKTKIPPHPTIDHHHLYYKSYWLAPSKVNLSGYTLEISAAPIYYIYMAFLVLEIFASIGIIISSYHSKKKMPYKNTLPRNLIKSDTGKTC